MASVKELLGKLKSLSKGEKVSEEEETVKSPKWVKKPSPAETKQPDSAPKDRYLERMKAREELREAAKATAPKQEAKPSPAKQPIPPSAPKPSIFKPSAPQPSVTPPAKQPQNIPSHTQSKNPIIAVVLSFIFAGLGQIYNGEIKKGIGFIVIQLIILIVGVVLFLSKVIAVFNNFTLSGFAELIMLFFSLLIIVPIILFIVALVNLWDAFVSAKAINAGKAGEPHGADKIYFFFEDIYYALMDKVNKVIPVYGMIDKIDERFPSFIVFLVCVFLLLFILIALLSPLFFVPFYTVTIQVEDKEGYPLQGLPLSVSFNEADSSSFNTDENGQVVISEVKANSVMVIEITEEEFLPYVSNEVEITDEDVFFRVVLEPKEEPKKWTPLTVEFLKPDGSLADDDILTVSFWCNGSSENVRFTSNNKNTAFVTNGKARLTHLEDCSLEYSIKSEKYEDIDTKTLVGDKVYLELKDNSLLPGTIHLKVLDSNSSESIGKTMTFDLFQEDELDLPVHSGITDAMGEKTFEFEPGWYVVSVHDSDPLNPEFFCEQSDSEEVERGETTVFKVYCDRIIDDANFIRVKVFDANTSVPLTARISLYKEEDSSLVQFFTEQSAVAFVAKENVSYEIAVYKEGYLPFEKTGVGLGETVEAELEKATPENSGTAEVLVKHPDSTNALNASVWLYYTDKGRRAPYPKEMTNAKGIATFTGVKPESYFAFAVYGDEQGTSSMKYVDINSVTTYNITMAKMRGAVKLFVYNADSPSKKLTDYTTKFFDSITGKDLKEDEDYFANTANSTYSFEAGTQVYALVSKEGYLSVRKDIPRIEKDLTQTVNVYLMKKPSGTSPKIKFVELTDLSGDRVNDYSVELGKEYDATFLVYAGSEEENSISLFDVHLRTGTNNSMGKDLLFLQSISSPYSPHVLKSTSYAGSYSPANYLADTKTNKVDANAFKFAQLSFDNIDEEFIPAFHVMARIKIREKIEDLNSLKLFYKALAVPAGSSDFPLTDPVDEERDRIEAYLYAKDYMKELKLDLEIVDGFGFIYSLKEAMEQEEECKAVKINGETEVMKNCAYEFFFTIVNRLDSYSNLMLFVENVTLSGKEADNITFNSYSINSSSKKGQHSGTAFSNLVPPFLTSFNPNEVIDGFTQFDVVSLGDPFDQSALRLKMQEGTTKAFQKYLPLKIKSDQELNLAVEASPEIIFNGTNLFPLIDATFTLTVTDEFNLPVFSTIDVFIDGEKYGETIFAYSGVASIDIDGQPPGKEVKFRAEASLVSGTAVEEKTFTVTSSGLYSITKEDNTPINGQNPLTFVFWADETEAKGERIKFTNLSEGIEEKLKSFDLEPKSTYLKNNVMLFPLNALTPFDINSSGKVIDFNVLLSKDANSIEGEEVITGGLIADITLFNYMTYPEIIPFIVTIKERPYTVDVKAYKAGKEITSSNPLEISFFSDQEFKEESFKLVNESAPPIEISVDEFTLIAPAEMDGEQTSYYLSSFEGEGITSDGTTIDLIAVLSDKGKEVSGELTAEGEIRVNYYSEKGAGTVIVPFHLVFYGEGEFEGADCNTGSRFKPKVLMDWRWINFNLNENNLSRCDDGYENYVYCDSTQFFMTVVYRLLEFKSAGEDSEDALLSFNSYLIKDGYSTDFFEDFDRETSSTSFAAPNEYRAWFDEYVKEGYIKVLLDKGGYYSNALDAPGLYKVDINFSTETIKDSFTSGASPSSSDGLIEVILSLKQTPKQASGRDSIFYSLPFNGRTGYDYSSNKFNRNGYGLSYSLAEGTAITLSKFTVESFELASSEGSGMASMSAEKLTEFESINSEEMKGKLLSIEKVGETNPSYSMKFSPSIATPIVLETELSSSKEKAFIEYGLTNDKLEFLPITLSSLAEWTGSEKCADYLGVSLEEGLLDGKASEEGLFELAWSNPNNFGKVFLKSIFFTPTDGTVDTLKWTRENFDSFAVHDGVLNALNDDLQYYLLHGTKQKFNDSKRNQDKSIVELTDLFELIDLNMVCVNDSAEGVSFSWREKTLLEESELDSVLAQGEENCIAVPFCGDGEVTGDEQCETDADCLGNAYCSLTGTTKCQCITFDCGDGIIDPENGEECDKGFPPNVDMNLGGETCETQGMVTPSIDCTGYELCVQACYPNPPLNCVDDCGLIYPECIDPEEFGLSCSEQCKFDFKYCLPVGTCNNDGIQNDEEVCDHGTNPPEINCSDVNAYYTSGLTKCTNCAWNFSSCGKCGNGEIDGTEQCDGTNLNHNDTNCATKWPGIYSGGTFSCTSGCEYNKSNCVLVEGETCGDGDVNANIGEECDPNSTDPAPFTYCSELDEGYPYGPTTCLGPEAGEDKKCKYDRTQCAKCGDGIIQPIYGEVCDKGSPPDIQMDLNDKNCETQGFDTGDLGCSSNCESFDISNCDSTDPFCGDNEINRASEKCDGLDWGNVTACTDLDFAPGNKFDGGGPLSCYPNDCVFNTSLCYECGDGYCNPTYENNGNCPDDCPQYVSCSIECKPKKGACTLTEGECRAEYFGTFDGSVDCKTDTFQDGHCCCFTSSPPPNGATCPSDCPKYSTKNYCILAVNEQKCVNQGMQTHFELRCGDNKVCCCIK
ncbi:MAG: hypothetical protein ABIE23_04100 [archaeon]